MLISFEMCDGKGLEVGLLVSRVADVTEVCPYMSSLALARYPADCGTRSLYLTCGATTSTLL